MSVKTSYSLQLYTLAVQVGQILCCYVTAVNTLCYVFHFIFLSIVRTENYVQQVAGTIHVFSHCHHFMANRTLSVIHLVEWLPTLLVDLSTITTEESLPSVVGT
jgi:hypothetical protein